MCNSEEQTSCDAGTNTGEKTMQLKDKCRYLVKNGPDKIKTAYCCKWSGSACSFDKTKMAGHKCEAPTPAPTPAPTAAPTAAGGR